MRPLRHHAQLFLVCSLLACSPVSGTDLFAQAQQPIQLDQLLTQIEANTERYSATVPSFICNEHILSQEVHDGKVKRETTVDAVFSVARSTRAANTLEESREARLIDGKPAANKKITMPLAFSGGFSGALTKYLSTNHRSCFNYAADPAMASHEGTVAYTFATKVEAARNPGCTSIQPGTTGKFTVDTASMQVTHIERTVQNPVGKDQTVLGTAAVDYAPVVLNGQSFWLPTTITAFTTETARTNSVRFTAKYSEYHRFTTTVTMLPADN